MINLTSRHEKNNIYNQMTPSLVCYADILGFSHLSKEAIGSGKGEQFLSRLRRALTKAYSSVKESAKSWLNEGDLFSIKIFTDNIVLGWPIPDWKRNGEYGEPEFGRIVSMFADFQVQLMLEGFLVRGGIAFGNHYMDDDVVFGDALLEAVSLDKAGGPPRISFSPFLVDKIILPHLGFYGKIDFSPHYECVLCDFDGKLFINYLYKAFELFPNDGGIFFEIIERHRGLIVNGLQEYKGDLSVRSKYEWVARYHNFICQETINNYKNLDRDSLEDEIIVCAVQEAQSLTDYLISLEDFAPMPSRMAK